MERMIKRVKLFVKDTPKAHLIEKKVKEELLNNNFEINDTKFDLGISIGGDGTFLKMMHKSNFDCNKYYASINAGSLGFLSSVDSDNLMDFITNLNNSSYKVKEIDVLKTKVYNKKEIHEYYSLNEFTVRKSDFSTFKSDLFINDHLLENYSGDGLVISTVTGSTGYSMVLGGAIIDNDLESFMITPIAPLNNKVYKSLSNSFIVSNKNKVVIIPKNSHNLCYLSDGEIYNTCFDKIECKMANKKIKLLVQNDYNYIDNIKSKIIDKME